MNVGEIKTALKRLAGVDDSDPLLTWINAAYHEFEDAYPWTFLETAGTSNVAAGTSNVTLPADLKQVIDIRIQETDTKLDFIPYSRLMEQVAGETGAPRNYTRIGSGMALWPIPDSDVTISIYYRKLLVDLDDDADVPEIPVAYHYALVDGAATYALRAESEEEKANTSAESFQEYISRATKYYLAYQDGSFNQVQDAQGYGDY